MATSRKVRQTGKCITCYLCCLWRTFGSIFHEIPSETFQGPNWMLSYRCKKPAGCFDFLGFLDLTLIFSFSDWAVCLVGNSLNIWKAYDWQVLEQHLAAAAFEYPLSLSDDEKYFGPGLESIIMALKNKGILSTDISRSATARIWSYIGLEVWSFNCSIEQ